MVQAASNSVISRQLGDALYPFATECCQLQRGRQREGLSVCKPRDRLAREHLDEPDGTEVSQLCAKSTRARVGRVATVYQMEQMRSFCLRQEERKK